MEICLQYHLCTHLLKRYKKNKLEKAVKLCFVGLEQAALTFERWGCTEVLITQAEGVLARVQGQTHYERFANRSVVGRTGRGDTTFGGYLAWRLEHNVEESLKFAAALVSIKMETAGPFQGTLDDVLKRMKG